MSKSATMQSIEAGGKPISEVGEPISKVGEPISKVRDEYDRHLANRPGIVRAAHTFLKGFQILCFALAGIFWAIGIIVTARWAFTGDTAGLAEAWVNYGLSMSFLVLPMGLDVLLLRVFPTDMYALESNLNSPKRTKLTTGVAALLAGLGLTLGGAPGTVHMINLASQALQSIF